MGRIARRLGCAAAAVLIILAAFAPAAAGPKTYVYDSLGRLSSVTNADGSIVTYAYDAADNRTAISTTPAGPPVLANETATLSQNSTNNEIGLNQTGGGTPTSASVIAQPTHGTTSVSGTHIYYTPTPGYTGPDSYQYNAANSSGASNTVTATITVILVPPTTGYSSATVAYNSSSNPIPLTIGGGTTAAVTVGTPPSHGVATASGTSITYTPTAGFSGYDNFTFTASNAAGSSGPGNVAITVTPQPPVAGPVSVLVAPNSVTNGIAPSLSGGAAGSVSVSSGPSHGVVSISGLYFSYTPTSGYSGTDSFQYTATNAGGTSNSAVASITVLAAPTTGYSTGTVAYGSSNNVAPLTLGGGTPTSMAITAQASHGTATVSGNSILYTPAASYSGSDTFQYTATNAAGTSGAGNVAITVNPQPPVANALSASVPINTVNYGISSSTSGGAASSITISAGPNHGTASVSGGYFSYTPASGYIGADSFSYTAANTGGTSAPAVVSIDVYRPVVAPTLGYSSSTVSNGSTNNSVPISLYSGDAPTSYAIATAPSHGTASVSGLAVLYTPAGGYTGSDSFQITGSNSAGTSPAANVGITVNPAPPVAYNVSTTVNPNSQTNGIAPSLGGGAADYVSVPYGPSHGTVSISGPYFSYTPTQGYSGNDSFQYTASNAAGTSAPATASIVVGGPTPVAQPAYITVPMNYEPYGFPAYTTGPSAYGYDIWTQPSHGHASMSGPYFSYYPDTNYTGPDSFTWVAYGSAGHGEPATITINVVPQ